MTQLLNGPMAFVIVVLIFFGVVMATMPSNRRHAIKMAEIKARGGEQFEAPTAEYTKLAQETRAAQATMQADLAAIRASVESIEQMMRDVG
jgi:Na+-transporting methylmalonyl-CoA/oxaloacetate decarboxylase gamma subunit